MYPFYTTDVYFENYFVTTVLFLWNAVAMSGNSNPLLLTYCTCGKCWNQFVMHCDNNAYHECWRCHSQCSPIAFVCVFQCKKITSHTVCATMGKGFGNSS